MNKVEIYYFTGTGNSLYVAKQLQEKLQKQLPDVKLIPSITLLLQHGEALNTIISGEKYDI